MIIVENDFNFDDINSFLPEAKKQFEKLSIFEKDEQTKIYEKMSISEVGLSIALGSLVENLPLNEFIVKHVSSKGEITKKKDLKTRQRQAYQTTGLSKSERRRIAIKASKTKRANPSGKIRATRKFKKALAKRKMYGLS